LILIVLNLLFSPQLLHIFMIGLTLHNILRALVLVMLIVVYYLMMT
jgi:hypothetical protein